jgi:RNA polymerase sigma-70 factor (ECF subfamily)
MPYACDRFGSLRKARQCHATLRTMATNSGSLSPQALDRLLESRLQFLKFIQNRVGTREIAEDILQAAFVKGLERGAAVRDEESAIAWFYRILRNAIIDYYRQRGAFDRASEALVRQLETHVEPEPSFKGEICQCVSGLLDTLKPQYRQALMRIDLEEGSLADLGDEAGITANNAAVRVHRAREALRRQVALACGACATHGCLDCECPTPAQN